MKTNIKKQYKTAIAVLIMMLMIVSVFGSAAVNVNGETILFDINDGTVSVIILVGAYEIENTGHGDEIFVEDFGRLLIPGKPNLPSKIFSIAIPPGAEFAEFSFVVSDGVVLPGNYAISPVPLPRVIGQDDPAIQERRIYDENYNTAYMDDDPYPASVVEFVRTSGYRKYNLIDVRVNPFTYYPLSGELIYYPEVDVHVSYTFPEGFSVGDIMVEDIYVVEQRAEKIIFNYDQAAEWYPNDEGGRETYDFVIITLDSLTSSVDSLVDWEEVKGKSVNVVTTSWIDSNYAGYDLAEKMRNFLIEKYPSGNWGILDVCLVGDYDDVPMRRCWQDQGYGKPETDYYYAELSLPDSQSWDADGDHKWGEDSDPIDFYAEVNVGRIPWSDPVTVEHICDKSVAYEQTDDPAFKKNILLLGAFFWSDTDNAVLMETKVDQDWMTDWTMTRLYEETQSSYPCDFDLNYNNVLSVWSTGSFAFVDWAGHGSPTACYEYYPSQSFVDTDTCNSLNDDYPAIIFADACSNSDTDDLNIGKAMLKQGGIGFLGATKVAYGYPGWNDPYDGSSQSLDYFFTTCCTSGDYTQGQALQWSLLEMYTNGLWYYNRYETFEWGALWGNPDISMAPIVTSDPPVTPQQPYGPTEGIPNEEYTFYTRTSDPNGDQIYYMWDWGNGEFSEWLGPYNSGENAYASNIWTELGDYEIRVKAKDEHSAKSDWSEALSISIVENQAPNAPSIDGPNRGVTGRTYLYKFVATDLNGHDVYYYVDWGDDTMDEWVGPYNSGEQAAITHTWTSSGAYTIKVKAKDVFDAESDWTTLEVTMPMNQLVEHPMLERFRNRFPLLYQITWEILQLLR